MNFQMYLHGKNMANVYKHLDMCTLPDEYLPDDYDGPSAGPVKKIIGQLLSFLGSIRISLAVQLHANVFGLVSIVDDFTHIFIPPPDECFRGILELACTSVCVQNTRPVILWRKLRLQFCFNCIQSLHIH